MPIPCSIDGCERKTYALSFCRAHYMRNRRHGDPSAGYPQRGAIQETFRRLTALETDDCIEWPYGANGFGYGLIRLHGRDHLVHRLALERRVPRPDDKPHALHTPVICHNKRCLNYRHLRWGTDADNAQDRILDGVARNQYTKTRS